MVEATPLRSACKAKNTRLERFTESGFYEIVLADTPPRQVRGCRLNYIRITWVAGTLEPCEFSAHREPVELLNCRESLYCPGINGPTRKLPSAPEVA